MFFKLERGDKVTIKANNITAVVTRVKWSERELALRYQVRYSLKTKDGRTISDRHWYTRRELKKIW